MHHLPKTNIAEASIRTLNKNSFSHDASKKMKIHSSDRAKNFGLTPDGFEKLVSRLRQGDETLFSTIFLAHFESCRAFLKKKFQLSHEHAYDITMDTLITFRRRLLEGKIEYGNIRFLFTRMASQRYLRETRQQASSEKLEEVQSMLEQEGPHIEKETLEVLNKAWTRLCDHCQSLLKRFYYEKASLKEIAEEQNKSAAALRKQKQRCVEKLRIHFKEFYQSYS
jgi:RNA polymerase sigma factor (sigma-70 family)